MNIDSPYNAILGRGWLGKMKAIASPYHQKLKFPSKEVIVVVKGKQKDTCHYFRLAMQSALTEKRLVELAKSLRTEGMQDVVEIDEPKEVGKRKGNIEESPKPLSRMGNQRTNNSHSMVIPSTAGHVVDQKRKSLKNWLRSLK